MIKKKILIADENKIIRETIASALMNKYSVYTVSDGLTLYKKYLEFKPDVIILNSDLSIFKGYEICKRIRETNKEINIIILSDSDKEFYIERFLSVNIQGYHIVKNVNVKSVVKNIEECIAGTNKEKISVETILRAGDYDLRLSKNEHHLLKYLLKGKISLTGEKRAEEQIKAILKKYKCKNIIDVVVRLKLVNLYQM